MRTKLIIAAILVQFLVLGWMAGQREWILRTGPSVWLRTAPIDPRDLFRGDYVTLGYEISTIPAGKFGPGLKKHLEDLVKSNDGSHSWQGDEIVLYSGLQVDPVTGIAEITTADLTPPPDGLFIKGRVRINGYGSLAPLMRVAYGIDAYYVQQGKGKALERRSPDGAPAGVQMPMEMRVALGSNGTAVLKGHRWNALGLGVQIERRKTVDSGLPPGSKDARKPIRKIIRVTLYNASTEPLAVVLPPDLRTLRLQNLDGGNGPGINVGVEQADLTPITDADVRLLQPGASTSAEIDPDCAEWFVKSAVDGPPHPLGHADGHYQNYRIVYEPPAPDVCRGLKEGGRIAPGALTGRMFGSYELRQD
jgi:uncharacterized membrane-anchored protein